MKKLAKRLMVFIFLTLLIPITLAQDTTPRLITVLGDAEIRVVPDEVILVLAVETINKNLSAATKENNERIQTIIAIAKEHEIEEKHIQTDYLSISPRYEDSWKSENFIGYYVNKSVVITIRDVSEFEKLLMDVLEAGANYVNGISFQTTELRKYKDQARILAIRAAFEKATLMANELGQKIGQPYVIQENQSGTWSRYAGGTQNTVQNVASSGSYDSEGTIALGQIKVKASVTVSFELKD